MRVRDDGYEDRHGATENVDQWVSYNQLHYLQCGLSYDC